MDKDVVKQSLDELVEFIKKTIAQRVQEYGKNRKGVNTLVGSDLVNDIKVTTTEDSIQLTIADYWMYVSTGWKFNDFKSPERGLKNALHNWALKKRVVTTNEEAWALAKFLQYQMIKKGRTIPARPFLEFKKSEDENYKGEVGGDLTYMIPELNTHLDEWFENLWNSITKELDKYFNAA